MIKILDKTCISTLCNNSGQVVHTCITVTRDVVCYRPIDSMLCGLASHWPMPRCILEMLICPILSTNMLSGLRKESKGKS